MCVVWFKLVFPWISLLPLTYFLAVIVYVRFLFCIVFGFIGFVFFFVFVFFCG